MSNKQLFLEINNILLSSEQPSKEIRNLIKEGKFDKKPLNQIKDLAKIDQNPKYHPEGDVLEHILLVVDNASKYKSQSHNEQIFMWAALLHDIGKITTTKIRKGRITSYNHDVEGENLAKVFLDELTDDENFKNKVSKLVRWHMQPLFYDKNLPFFTPQNMINDVEYKEIALLSLCDRLGRGNLTKETEELEKERIKNFEKYFS